MKVEGVERARTLVWMFRFPYFVERASGILAVSSCSSCSPGFSITRAASGSRNSIFAKALASGVFVAS